MQNAKNLSGFTLLELMITLSIAIIITTIGVPSFQGLIKNSRLTAHANDLISALNYARSEAITRNTDIRITKIGGGAGVWEGGWKIEEGTLLLKQHEPLNNSFTLRTGGTFNSWVAFTSEGLSVGSGGLGNDTFTLCDSDADITTSRRIILNNIGRARIVTGSASCP